MNIRIRSVLSLLLLTSRFLLMANDTIIPCSCSMSDVKVCLKESVEFSSPICFQYSYIVLPTQGVPVMAIRNKMISEGLNPDLLE